MNIDDLYKDLLKDVLKNGELRETRNGHTLSLFGTSLTFDMEKIGLPVLSLRRIFTKGIVGEFRGFLADAKTVQEFEELGCPYWKLWAKEDGSLNLDYPPREQLDAVIESIKNDPMGRRHIINLWDHTHLDDLSLPCCHFNYQFYVRNGKLDMIWTQRSVDVAVGLPSDFILAALYVKHISASTGLNLGRITMNFGDTHIYEEHITDVTRMIERSSVKYFQNWSYDGKHISMPNYEPKSAIKFLLKD